MAEHAEELGLEIGKIRAGHYLVEGWECTDGKNERQRSKRWRAARFAETLYAPSFGELKEKIWDHRNDERIRA